MPSTTTDVEICNLALGEIGSKSLITSLDPSEGVEARHCAMFYKATCDMVLREVDWGFARKTIAIAQLSEDPPPPWIYRYQYPNDCLNARKVVSAVDGKKPQKFQIGISNDLNGKNIFTDQEEAYLVYTAMVTNPTLFDAGFINALKYAMGAVLAMPLTKKKGIQDKMQNAYQLALARAAMLDANEGHEGAVDDLYQAEATEARLGG